MLELAREVLNPDQLAKLHEILAKDKLSPLEMMQEAAFTELLNRRSLEQL